MKKIPLVFWREFSSYFFSPIAYIVLAVFLIISGYFFSVILNFSQEATLRYALGNISIILLFLSPLISMRLLAEEKRSGTMETLMTDPVTDGEVVLGKFLASFCFYLTLLLPTLLYALILKVIGNPDPGPIFTGYLGLVLMGSVFLAVGLLASSFTDNQMIAAVVSFVTLLLFWVIDWSAGGSSTTLAKVLSYLGIFRHFDSFSKGIIDTRDIIYYLSTTALFLSLTVRVVEARRWR